jgi:metallo-beta-lactamase class B
MVLTAHLTAGHTRGCTTWTFRVTQDGKSYNVVIVGSPKTGSQRKVSDHRAGL